MTRSSRLAFTLMGFSLGVVHCSSSSQAVSGSDGREASAPMAEDADADAAICPSVAQRCTDAAPADWGCDTTWSTAQQPSTWCDKLAPFARVYIAPNCDGFNVVVLGYVDTSEFHYYDTQTGELVGIESHGNVGASCLAGQAPDVPLTDCYDAGGRHVHGLQRGHGRLDAEVSSCPRRSSAAADSHADSAEAHAAPFSDAAPGVSDAVTGSSSGEEEGGADARRQSPDGGALAADAAPLDAATFVCGRRSR